MITNIPCARRFSLLGILFLLVSACAHGGRPGDLAIIDRPVPFTQERIELTRLHPAALRARRYKHRDRAARIIVLHWTAGGTFQGDYNTFGHPLWLERDSTYRTGKTDPGQDFMAGVRSAVADLRLKGPAEIAREKRN